MLLGDLSKQEIQNNKFKNKLVSYSFQIDIDNLLKTRVIGDKKQYLVVE